jgi:hypothetical protein
MTVWRRGLLNIGDLNSLMQGVISVANIEEKRSLLSNEQ